VGSRYQAQSAAVLLQKTPARTVAKSTGEPSQKTPGTVAENPETVAKTPPSQKQRYKEKTPLSQNILVTVAKNTSPTPPAPER
jgi:hypothetical protein